MVLQDPLSSFNPVRTDRLDSDRVGHATSRAVQRSAREQAIEALAGVRLPDARSWSMRIHINCPAVSGNAR